MRTALTGVAVSVLVLTGCAQQPVVTPTAPPSVEARLTNEQLAARLFIVGTTFSQVDAYVGDFLARYPLAGLMVHEQMAPTPEALTRLTSDLRARYDAEGLPPPIIAVDQEGEPVLRLPYAGPATAQTELTTADQAYDLGRERGLALARLGITWNFAPVLDLADPGDALYDRTLRGSPQEVAQLGTSLATGLQESAIVPCVKHFPGLGGLRADTHQASAQRTESLSDWLERDYLPFKQAIESGAACLMLSHATTDWWGDLPTSINPRAVSFLRDEAHFDGILISDDLTMQALTNAQPIDQAAVSALQAGLTGLVVTGTFEEIEPLIQAVAQALEQGSLSRTDMEQRARRLATTRAIPGN